MGFHIHHHTPHHEASEEKYIRLTQTPVPKLIIRLGLPTIASMLITSIYNMADTYFVGTLGKSASGAIGIVFSLMAVFQAVGFTFGQGSGANISQKLGQKDTESATKIASVGFWSAFLTGCLLGTIGLIFLEPLVLLLGSTDTILPYAKDYARFILIACPFFTTSCVLNNILRYEGMAVFSMIGLGLGGILNMILDPIFILGLHLGTAGAGLATGLSQIISFSILLHMFLSGRTESKIRFRIFIQNIPVLKPILSTGFPALLRQGLGSLSGLFLNHQAAIYGDAAVAAMSIVNRITQFVFSVGIGIGQGFQPVAAFNYGAKKYSRVKKGFWFTAAAGEALIGALALLCFIFSPTLATLFQPDETVVAIVVPALRIHCIGCLFLPFSTSGNMMFQSTGLAGKSAVLSALRSGLCFIPLVLILPVFFDLTGIQLAQPIADLITFIVSLPMVLRFLRSLPKDEM